jgi:hypothetical protein
VEAACAVDFAFLGILCWVYFRAPATAGGAEVLELAGKVGGEGLCDAGNFRGVSSLFVLVLAKRMRIG